MKLKIRIGQKNMSCICCDSEAHLKTLQAAKAKFPLIEQCQQVLNGISVGLYWVPGHA
jgi:hypothetical protein